MERSFLLNMLNISYLSRIYILISFNPLFIHYATYLQGFEIYVIYFILQQI